MSLDLAADQLEDVLHALKNPLTGCQVMVPFTSKAFRRGKLQPILTTANTNPLEQPQQKAIEEEEQVWINVQSEKKLVTRVEACRWIQDSMDQLKPILNKQKLSLNSIQNSLNPISDGAQRKKEKGNNQTIDNTLPKATTMTTQKSNLSLNSHKTAASEEFSLPMFDIREEYNDDGAQVHAEAINITQQLRVLQQQFVEGEGEENNQSNIHDDDANSHLKLHEQELTVRDDPMESDDQESSHRPPSDAEYQALAQRLEELARLEEESEKGGRTSNIQQLKPTSRAATTKGGTGPKESGWTKGFLLKSDKKKGTENNATKYSETIVQSNAEKTSQQADISGETAQVRQVRFQADVDMADAPSYSSTSPPKPKMSPLLLEPNLFTGIVRERTLVQPSTPIVGKVEDSPTPSSTTATTTTNNTEPPKKKKLSRFAMERMQQQQPTGFGQPNLH